MIQGVIRPAWVLLVLAACHTCATGLSVTAAGDTPLVDQNILDVTFPTGQIQCSSSSADATFSVSCLMSSGSPCPAIIIPSPHTPGVFDASYYLVGTYDVTCHGTTAAGETAAAMVEILTISPPILSISAQSPFTYYPSSGQYPQDMVTCDVEQQITLPFELTVTSGDANSVQISQSSPGEYSVAYTAGGSYSLTCSLTDMHGLSGSATATIRVLQAPVVSISGDTPLIDANILDISFPTNIVTCSGTDDQPIAAANYQLDTISSNSMFAMIDASLAPDYSVQYFTAGVYTVRCTLTDSDGLTATAQMDIVVQQAPYMNAFGNTAVTIHPAASPPYPNGAVVCAATDDMPFPSGNIHLQLTSGDAAGVSIADVAPGSYTVTYSAPGVYVLTCSATDTDGQYVEKDITVTVTQDPVVSLTGDSLVVDQEPLDTTFPMASLTCSATDDKPLPADPYSLTITSGNSAMQVTDAGAAPMYAMTFYVPGTYAYECCVTDADQLTACAQASVVVLNGLPVID